MVRRGFLFAYVFKMLENVQCNDAYDLYVEPREHTALPTIEGRLLVVLDVVVLGHA